MPLSRSAFLRMSSTVSTTSVVAQPSRSPGPSTLLRDPHRPDERVGRPAARGRTGNQETREPGGSTMNVLATVVKTAKQEKRKAKQARFSSVAAACDDSNVSKPVRVNGPYPEAGKWRIYLIDGSGRKSFFFDSRAEAETMKAKLVAKAKALTERTIGESLDDYCEYRLR